MKRFHLFKTGRQTSSQGQTLDFTEADLKASVDAYDPSIHEAPIVIGHPKNNGPAWGWVSSLQFSEDGMSADPDQVDPDFEEMVQAGRFKKVSASFYAPESANNPVPGVYYLRHVGFLGAQPPAVKGLKAIEFSEDDEVIEFSSLSYKEWDNSNIAGLFRKLREFLIDKFSKEEADEVLPTWTIEELEDSARRDLNDPKESPAFAEPKPKATEGAAMSASEVMTKEELEQAKKDLETREQALKDKETSFSEKETAVKAAETAITKKEIDAELAELVKAGKLTPAQKTQVADFMASLDGDIAGKKAVVEFGEGDQKKTYSQRAFMREFLSQLPKAVDFKEHSKDDDDTPPENSNELAQQALEYQETERKKGRTVSISQAVYTVQKGEHKPG